MSDDFIDGDPFDPEVIREAEDKTYASQVDQDTQVSTYLARRKQAYCAVFREGNSSQDDLELVMLDLAMFCRAYEPTFNASSPKVQDLQEGRREVFLRIMDHMHLSHDTLFVKYTDALNKIGN